MSLLLAILTGIAAEILAPRREKSKIPSSNDKSNPCPQQAGKIQMTKRFEHLGFELHPPSLKLRNGQV